MIVCATRSHGKTVEVVERLAPDYSIVWINKETNPPPDQDRRNRETADEIIREVRRAIKTAQRVEA